MVLFSLHKGNIWVVKGTSTFEQMSNLAVFAYAIG